VLRPQGKRAKEHHRSLPALALHPPRYDTSDSIGLGGQWKLTLVQAQSRAMARKGSADSKIGALVKEQAAILGQISQFLAQDISVL